MNKHWKLVYVGKYYRSKAPEAYEVVGTEKLVSMDFEHMALRRALTLSIEHWKQVIKAFEQHQPRTLVFEGPDCPVCKRHVAHWQGWRGAYCDRREARGVCEGCIYEQLCRSPLYEDFDSSAHNSIELAKQLRERIVNLKESR